MKQRKLWKTGEDGLCCSSSAIQTRLGPSSLLEERSEVPIVLLFFCVVGYPPNWGKWPRYIDRLCLGEDELEFANSISDSTKMNTISKTYLQ